VVAANPAPGATGLLLVSGNDLCLGVPGVLPTTTRPLHISSLAVGLPGGDGSFEITRFPSCQPVSVSQLGTQVTSPVPGPLPGSAESLRATLKLPTRVYGGRVLAFVVMLTNSDASPVSLLPCPGYTESVALLPPVQRSYELNCRSIPALAPSKSISFAMEIPVPAVPTAEGGKIAWGLDVGPGALAGPSGIYYLVARAVTIYPAPVS
jgi:hypothetical protein